MKTTFIVETKTKTNINSKEYYYEKKKKKSMSCLYIHIYIIYTGIETVIRRKDTGQKKLYYLDYKLT